MKLRSLITTLTTAVAVSASAFIGVAPASATPTQQDMYAYDKEMFNLVNKERTANGLKPLQWYEPAHIPAEGSSQYMLNNKLTGDKFDHLGWSSTDDTVVGCGDFSGENIFYEIKSDYRNGVRSPEASYAVEKYMNSKGHRENILRPEYTHFAAGTVYDPATGSLFNTQRFLRDCNLAKNTSPRLFNNVPSYLKWRTGTVQDGLTNTSVVTNVSVGGNKYTLPQSVDDMVFANIDGSGDSIISHSGNLWTILVPSANGGFVSKGSIPYGRSGDQVIVGRWEDNAPVDGVGVRRGNVFHLKNHLGSGNADYSIAYGRSNDQMYTGDFNGDNMDTPVVRRGNLYYFKNAWAGGDADVVTAYGRPDDQVFIGDWDGDGEDTFMVRRGSTMYFKNSLSGGAADYTITDGSSYSKVFIGDFNKDGKDEYALFQ